MSGLEASESDVLQSLVPQYEAEGFDVYVNPSPSILPPFMKEHRPDAIALRPDKKIAIEVIRSEQASSHKMRRLQSLLSDHADWELRVFYISSMTNEKAIEIASASAIQSSIERTARLISDGYRVPALIMAWATLEAIGRALLPDQFRRPQTPARLVETLAAEGYLTPVEADQLRAAIPARNSAVHGSLAPDISDGQVNGIVAILRTLAGSVQVG